MFHASWNSQMHQIETAELAAKNLHLFRIDVNGREEELVFQGLTRKEAQERLVNWLKTEPHCKELP